MATDLFSSKVKPKKQEKVVSPVTCRSPALQAWNSLALDRISKDLFVQVWC